MPGSFSPAEIALAATVVEQELADLQVATDYHSAAGWEYLQDYPRDRFDLLFRLALLPECAKDGPGALDRYKGKTDLTRPAEQLLNLPLTRADYDLILTFMLRQPRFSRAGIRPYDTPMVPEQDGQAIFELLSDCGLLEQRRKTWHWTPGMRPHLGAPPPPQPPVQSPLYDELPLLLRGYLHWIARSKDAKAFGQAIRRHRRGGRWHLIPMDSADAGHELELTQIVRLMRKFFPRH